LRDGRPAVMPSDDFQHMSDQELSDIISYIRSLPAVDNTVPKSTFGPLGRCSSRPARCACGFPARHPHPVSPGSTARGSRVSRVRQAPRLCLHGMPRARLERRTDRGRRSELAAGA
jgi:hypothetical protein